MDCLWTILTLVRPACCAVIRMITESSVTPCAQHPCIQCRKNQQRQCCRSNQSANHDGRQRTLHFGAGSRRQRHRNKPKTGDERRHEYGPEPRICAFADCFIHGEPLFAQLRNIGQQYHAIENGHAEERNKADSRRKC